MQAEDGIRALVRSRGLGDVYKRQALFRETTPHRTRCLLYTSDAADDLLRVDLGGRRIIKKKTTPFKSLYSPSLSYTNLTLTTLITFYLLMCIHAIHTQHLIYQK